MSGRLLGFLFITGILYSCTFNGDQPVNDTEKSYRELRIENSPNRGLNYTDKRGIKYSYRNIPVTVFNDGETTAIISIFLANEYNYPQGDHGETFRVFVIPPAIAEAEVTWDSLSYELNETPLRRYFDQGVAPATTFRDTLKPGEQYAVTFGTLYPQPTNCGVVPKALVLNDNHDRNKACVSLPNPDFSISSSDYLNLQLGLCAGANDATCIRIPCGEVQYTDARF